MQGRISAAFSDICYDYPIIGGYSTIWSTYLGVGVVADAWPAAGGSRSLLRRRRSGPRASSILTTVTHNTMGHPPTASSCCVDASLHRQGGGGDNVGKKHAVCVANTCIMLVHVCVAPYDSPYCPALPQSAVPTHPPAGTNKAHTCGRRCVRRMASDLAGRGRSSRRLHSTQRHQRCVPNASGGAGGQVHLKCCPPPCSRHR